jgi:hypothetical protein
MNALHIVIWDRGNDRCLQVIANSLPYPGESQELSITALKVERLTIAGTPFVKATGWNEASVRAECIPETREGIYGLTPVIEKRRPAS